MNPVSESSQLNQLQLQAGAEQDLQLQLFSELPGVAIAAEAQKERWKISSITIRSFQVCGDEKKDEFSFCVYFMLSSVISAEE